MRKIEPDDDDTEIMRQAKFWSEQEPLQYAKCLPVAFAVEIERGWITGKVTKTKDGALVKIEGRRLLRVGAHTFEF